VSGLAQLQAQFQAYLLGQSTALLDSVANTPPLGAADRLAVYRFAYGQRLVDALGNDFPGLLALLGQAGFAELARGYLAHHPSRHGSLRWLGRSLIAYIEGGATAALSPLALDMARFDWAVAQAFDAADQPPITMLDVLALPPAAWETFRLGFADSLSLFSGDAVIGDLRRALLREIAGDLAASGEQVAWLVWRQNEEIQFRSATAQEDIGLAYMRAGGTFGGLCERLAAIEAVEAPARRAAELVKDWVERDMVIGLWHESAVSS
jgi:hypothetical protein